jgi:hypothetical protein
MSKVHRLITDHGKQAALNFGERRGVVEAAAAYLGNEQQVIECLYSGWCQAALPHKRVTDSNYWQIDSEFVSLIVESGVVRGGHGKPVPVGLPFGSKARLILLYLQAEALRTNSREVELGKSMRAWMTRMGIPSCGKNITDVRDQSNRLARCRITFHFTRGKKHALVNQNIMDTAMFEDDENQDQDGVATTFVDRAFLSEVFFQELKRHPVPLEESAIRALSNNSQGLDVYAWLAYRLHSLSKPTPIAWPALKAQFGAGVSDPKNFRRLFLPNLALSLAVYPDAKVEQTDAGLVLYPSRPPVAPRQIQIAVG